VPSPVAAGALRDASGNPYVFAPLQALSAAALAQRDIGLLLNAPARDKLNEGARHRVPLPAKLALGEGIEAGALYPNVETDPIWHCARGNKVPMDIRTANRMSNRMARRERGLRAASPARDLSKAASPWPRRCKAPEVRSPGVFGHVPNSAERSRSRPHSDFVHLRSNPIEFLSRWQQQLGIKD